MKELNVRFRIAVLALLSADIWALPAGATDYTVTGGATDTGAKTVSGTDTVTVEANGKLSTNQNATINWNNASTGLKITNSGTIESTKSGGRAIDTAGANNARSLTLENKKGAIIRSDDDAVRIKVNPTGGTVTVNNAGTIQSTTGQALDFDAAASGSATITIDNAATGTIKSGGDDAIRPGQGATVNNSGTIRTDGQAANKADGIDFKDATAGTVNNKDSGTISGARHGITLGGNNGAGSITVTNAANASITGRNGSGVGSDAGGTVTNYGTIEGAYSGTGAQDGDGDGVDIDFAGTIENHGTIKGTGAGGYDSGGRANNSEGISLGGGTITNSGAISGAAYGIVVNNDSNTDNSRSGMAATTITNDVGGTIEGKGGYAIRLENKLGTAADNDTIVNRGTITGNGTIPDPTAIVTLKNGSVDGGSVGILDGVTYTGTGSARFIRGDGAAIQMGEGNDTLTNYGTITGNSGRAISLEGGNDTLNLYTGSTITGRIDGGTGTDTLNLGTTGAATDIGTVANVINFEVLNVNGGTWKLLDDQSYANGAVVAAGATLRIGDGATGGSITANIANIGALVFDRTDATSYAGTISGTGSLTKANTGTLTLSGANTYTGATRINSGTLRAGAVNVIGPGSAVILDGGTFDLHGYDQTIGSLAGTNNAAAVALGSAVLTVGTDNTRTNYIGAITGSGGLAKVGTGSLDLLGALSYTGATTVENGTLRVLGTMASTRFVLSGGSLVLQNPNVVPATSTILQTGGVLGIPLSGMNLEIGSLSGSGGAGIVFGSRSALTVGRNGTDDTYGGAIGTDGNGALTKVGTGSLTLTGQSGYTGATTISGGTLALSGSGSVTFSSGVALATGATLDISGLTGSGTAITALADTAPGQAGAVALGAKTLAITNANGSFGGTITGTGGLTLAGGAQTLTGTNTYTGTTTVSGGVLTIHNATALGAADGTAATGTTVASGAALELQGGIAVGNEALSLAGYGVNNRGALRSVSGDNSYAGAITLTGNAQTIAVDAGTLSLSGDLTGVSSPNTILGGQGDGLISGQIRGVDALFKRGGGTWTLAGAATLGTDAYVSDGTLRLAAGGTLSNATGHVDAQFGGTAAAVTVTGTGSRWSNAGNLFVGDSAAGTLTVAAGGAVSVGPAGTGTLTLARGSGSTGTLIIGAAVSQAPVAAGSISAAEVAFGSGTGALIFNHTGNPDGSAATFAPRITGAGAVGHLAGTTILTGANTYTGGTGITGGTLSAANATALGTAAATVTAGGTLDVDGVTLGNALRIAGTGAGGLGALTGTGTAGISGPITLTGDAALGGHGTLTVARGIGDGGAGYGLAKVGTGTAILTAANTYTGGTTVTGGTLALAGSGTLGSARAATAVTGVASVLDLGDTRQTQAAVSLSQGATVRNGALSAPVASSGGTLARIAGPATLATTGGTTVSTANSYTGVTTVGDGSILTAGGTGGFSAASAYTLAGSGILDLAGADNTVGALAGSAATTVTSSAGGPAVLTVAGLSAGSFAGAIRDGAGPVGLTLAGAGPLTLTGTNTYTGATTIGRGATLRLGDGGTAGAIAATAGVVNDGALILDRADAVAFAPAISGSGSLTQAGTGTTVLTGRNTYTGATTIAAGTLQIDGVLAASDVTVKSGGTLSGSGKIGDPLIESGGRLAPGSAAAIGTLSITGPLTFAAGSFYTVKVAPGANDRTNVTGPVTIQGGTVQVLAGSGTYTPALRYTLLTATGGVTGQFSSLQTTGNLAFLTPSLAYDARAVYLGFAQTAPIVSAATTPNQAGVAQALAGAGPTVTSTTATAATVPTPSSVTTQVSSGGTTTTTVTSAAGTTTVSATPAAQVATAVLNQTAPGAAQALTVLAGEVQGSAAAAAVQTALAVENVLLDHLRFDPGGGSAGLGGPGLTGTIGQRFAPGTTLPAAYSADRPGEPVVGLVPVRPASPNYALWGRGFGVFGTTSGTANTARVTRQTGGFVLGLESGFGALTLPGLTDLRVGVAAGYSVTGLDIPARQSTAQIESGFGGVYARAALGPVRLRLGAAYAGDATDTRRTVLFPGFSQAMSGKAGGDTVQGFGEVGYRIAIGSDTASASSIEPFVGAAAFHIRRDGFTETGGAAALTVFGRGYDLQTATAGVQGAIDLSDLLGTATPIQAQGLVGYRRAFGDVVPQALMAFGGGRAFLTSGAPIARDALVASAGLQARVSAAVTLGLAYTGQIGDRAQDHGLRGSVTVQW